jgi:hypothetical protein
MSEAISTMQRIFPGKFVLLFMHPSVVIVTSQQRVASGTPDTGVHGRLADLCKPINRKYSQAISVAAGSRMDHVVR